MQETLNIAAILYVALESVINVLFFRMLPIVVLSLGTYAFWQVLERLRGTIADHTNAVRSAALGFAFVGATAGMLIGGSRTSIGDAGLTGFLGLVTAFSAYAFAKESLNEYRAYAVPILVTLSLALILGSYYGAAIRQQGEAEALELQQVYKNTNAAADARRAICKETAKYASLAGADPETTMSTACRLELGFVTPE